MKLPLLLLLLSLPSLALSAKPQTLSSPQKFFAELNEFAGFKVVRDRSWTEDELAIVSKVAQRRPADFTALLNYASSFKGETLSQVREDAPENKRDRATFLNRKENLSFKENVEVPKVLKQLRRVKEPLASVRQHLFKSITYLRDDLVEKANALPKPSLLKYIPNLFWTQYLAPNELVFSICPDVEVSTHMLPASWMQQTANALFDCLKKRIDDVDTPFKASSWKETLFTIRIFRHSIAKFVKEQQQVNEQSENLESVTESKFVKEQQQVNEQSENLESVTESENLDPIEVHADQLASVLCIIANDRILTVHKAEPDVIGDLNRLSENIESDRLQKNASVQPLDSKEENMEENMEDIEFETPFQIGQFFF